MVKERIKYAVIIAISVIAITITAVVYSLSASTYIFNESKEHLMDIYSEVRVNFLQALDSSRKLMNGWIPYIDSTVRILNDDTRDDATKERAYSDFINFIEKQRSKDMWSFTNFYFVGHQGELTPEQKESVGAEFNYFVRCKNIYGEDATFNIRRSLNDLLQEGKGGVVGKRNDGEKFIMIAWRIRETYSSLPTVSYVDSDNESKQADFDGFEYRTLAITYLPNAMENLLKIDAFHDKGHFYVALPDGNVLVQTQATGNTHPAVNNIFDHMLQDNLSLTTKTLDQIKADWKGIPDATGKNVQQSDVSLMEENGEELYISYMPIGFGDWMLVGVVPSSEVNDSMYRFRSMTITVMVIILAVVVAAVILVLVILSRHRYKKQQLEVSARENLLEVLTLDSNDIFAMFSPKTFVGDYISYNINKVLGIDAASAKSDVRNIFNACAIGDVNVFDKVDLAKLEFGQSTEMDIGLHNVLNKTEYWYKLLLYRTRVNGIDTFIMMLSDRTNDRALRDKLEEALKIAENANAAKSNFLSNMSHDIRTPMNAIIGYATLMAKDVHNPDRVRDYTHKITYSGKHLLSLINDILDMSKIESGKTSLNMEEFSLPEFIEELYSMMVAQSNAKRQSFDVHTKGKIPEFVLGDKLRLNQVMLNLLSNAVKYTPAGGAIELRVETMKQMVRGHAHVRFTVSDNGIGMSPEYVKTIFEPFTREETSQTKGIQGTGLGMAITKNIIDLMGGTITVESELGKGSTFTVELELSISEKGPDEYDEDFWKHHNVTRVLVVDDEEDVCMEVKELMSDTGVDIDYVLNGKDAVDAVVKSVAEKNDYHIVLLDWKMPEIDGLETAKRIRKKVGRGIPIMVLTSYSFEDIENEAKEAGIDMFLSKPFFVTNFRRAVMKIRSDGNDADITPEDVQDVSLDGLKVLAAEDNEINAEILVELMEIEGVTCDIAIDGKDALEKFEASEPGQYDLIFMDIQMPVMNGYESTRAIRQSSHPDAKTIPIVAMSANAFDTDVKDALNAGMNAHLAKPVDIDKLKQTVTKVLSDHNKHSGK